MASSLLWVGSIMALLHYANLDDPNPAVLFDRTTSGLRDFYEFLKRTRDHLEHEDNVLRLGWATAEAPEWQEGASDGVWIELTEPAADPNVPDRTFDAFLDEEVHEVYEMVDGGEGRATARVAFHRENRLRVLDRDPHACRLLLESLPESNTLCLRPNTSTIRRQLEAVWQLQDAPAPAHRPLLRLFEREDLARWPPVTGTESLTWRLLHDPSRPGTDAQRRFVELASWTPDFAFLEGPPGSGKTTAICELVLQLVARGKRVLLCASTHVAVDNVLERLGPLSLSANSDLVSVRVGERRKVSEGARPFQLEEFVRTERERLLRFLRGLSVRSSAQEALYRSLSAGSSTVERMVLDAANLVCGTTAGILQHPDIKGSDATRRAGMFDMLILDEASKTTFQDFLVPALLARRWVIVGDPRQLSPFVEEAALAANLRAALPVPTRRDACVDVFLAKQARAPRASAVVPESPTTMDHYRRQATAHGVEVADVAAATPRELATAAIVVGSAEHLEKRVHELPLDLATLRGVEGGVLARRAAATRARLKIKDAPPCWEDELAWRLCRHFEQRQRGDSTTALRLRAEADALMPAEQDPSADSRLREQVERVRRVAFPSILESLQLGFRSDVEARGPRTALADGVPAAAFAARHVLLTYQHRMHPDISRAPREHVYQNEALVDSPDMTGRRRWTYSGYDHRAVWLHVPGKFDARWNRNEAEVDAILRELDQFFLWAKTNPKPPEVPGGAPGPWEVAVLPFYRGQERAVRERLRRTTGQRNAHRHFEARSEGRVYARVELCTVDRFQGHEADLVLLSITNTRVTNFLESANRMNVALTRARYQRVIVGDRNSLGRREGCLLQHLARHEPWARHLEAGR